MTETRAKLKKMEDEGRAAFNAYARACKLPRAERNEDYSVTDAIVALMHYARAQGWAPEELIESAKGHYDAETLRVETCAKCGAGLTQDALECGEVFTDEGTGPEAGRTFYYCSQHCCDTH